MDKIIYTLTITAIIVLTGCRKEYVGAVSVKVENTLGDQALRVDISDREGEFISPISSTVFKNVPQTDFIVLRCITSSDYNLSTTNIGQADDNDIKYFYFSTQMQYKPKRNENYDIHMDDENMPVLTIRTVKSSDAEGLDGFSFIIVEELPE